ncbi:hypothetical protein [Prevotella melaninogenica]|uniref:Uncharacterized protein n=1 Tax=Prevotella melaninogenica DNF00666 TaxID=1401073 RepID=A0A096BLQ7_9BACT|nr:hypothetical protein [Prevotella melaninogenica]KGF43632.1 hypothetical protein HMPREF0661_11780 [Prevotella melaninogenica DNF00666]
MDEDELLYREMNEEAPWYMGDDLEEDIDEEEAPCQESVANRYRKSHPYKGYRSKEAYEENQRRQFRSESLVA